MKRTIKRKLYKNKPTVGFLHLRNIPPGLKSRFKSWCGIHGITMSSQVMKMMSQLLKKHECPEEEE